MKIFTFLIMLSVLLVSQAFASDFQMMKPEVLRDMISGKAPLHLVDIQLEQEFDTHSLPGAIATYAFPVKSDSDLEKLQTIVADLKQSSDPVIIVCPRGKGGAQRTYRYLETQGVQSARLQILEGGQQGWPYEELVVKK